MRAGFHEKFIPFYLRSAVVCKPTGMRVAGPFSKRCIVTPRMYQPGFAVYITTRASPKKSNEYSPAMNRVAIDCGI
jgi:hypothetical protein